MTRVDRACLVAVVLGGLVFPSYAHAQSADAEALFRDGRNLIRRGKTAAGCDKLAASERLESSVGTLLNLGDCREKLGKLASAWAAFRKAEAMAKRSGGDDKRRDEAARRAAQLEPRLANLEIDVPHGVEGLIESYELAFRMQAEMPKVLDLANESKETMARYGINAASAGES